MQPDTTEISHLLQEVVFRSLETMAFFSCAPAEPGAACPSRPIHIRMNFSGPLSGSVELITGRYFGQRLASNVLCCGVEDEEAIQQAEDCIRETLNVVVGAMMPRLARDAHDVFNLSLPRTQSFEPAEWERFVSQPGTLLIDAEGDTIAARLNTP